MSEYKGFSEQVEISTIEQAMAGNANALEALYRAYAKPCYQLAMRLTSNPQASQDIVHEVFVKIIRKVSQYQHKGNFAGWVRQIAANESIDYLKRNKRIEDEYSYDEIGTTADDLFENAWWDAVKDLNTLTASLNDTARAVLFLHELEGFSHKEIAELFKRSESFSKQTLARTIAQLKQMSAIKEHSHASF